MKSKDPGRGYSAHSSRRRAKRTYRTPLPGRHVVFLVLLFIFSGLLAYGSIRLFTYIREAQQARQVADAIRQAYYAVTDAPAQTAALPASTETAAPAPAADIPAPTTNPDLLPARGYPGNPYTIVTSRFREIQKLNDDIIGWLSADDLIDQAVVQRDNAYYLDRDYLGNQNSNGAIFLDEHCDLSTRPYTYLLYGHNMKTGTMFGSLRNYENVTYLTSYPFITFDTAYETGRYAVFAAGTVSTDKSSWQYLDLTRLCSPLASLRSQAIRRLKELSVFDCPLDVRPDDQLLLLITCVEDDSDRRVVAARRIRNNESDASLLDVISHTHVK
ncbi:MAG: class B sortase [Clostridiales bacterium]|nr:class B sortase [Clostridiales bacterium]